MLHIMSDSCVYICFSAIPLAWQICAFLNKRKELKNESIYFTSMHAYTLKIFFVISSEAKHL